MLLTVLTACLLQREPVPAQDTAAAADDTGVSPPTTASRTEGTGPRAVIHPEAWDFGEIGIDCEGSVTLVLTNVGDAPLDVRDVALMGNSEDFVLGDVTPHPLEAGETLGILVLYRPSDTYGDNGFLRVRTDDPVEDELLVPLSGDAGGERCD